MVAGEQQALRFKQIADVIRGVAGCAQGTQRTGVGRQGVAVGQHAVGRETRRADAGQRDAAAVHRHAAVPGQLPRAGGVVRMGVRDQHGGDGIAHGAFDGIQVRRCIAGRVDDQHLTAADQVGVGAGAGHQARIGRRDAPHARPHVHRRRERELGTNLGRVEGVAGGVHSATPRRSISSTPSGSGRRTRSGLPSVPRISCG